ncbi:hypothetical protein LBMAG42_44200 [Deltaproteobacteria bacterium]|nr:hypothetical protein LBMAG42_44200 [Deltaproteobacteria bacterium]
MTLMFFLGWMASSAQAADRADTLAARAEKLFHDGKREPARRVATRSVGLRENVDALSVLLLIELLDLDQVGDDAAAEARWAKLVELRIAQLDVLQPNTVAVGIARTVLTVQFEGELLPALVPVCPDQAKGSFSAAEASFARHELKEALGHYDEALAACPNQATWWTYSGDALHGLGDLRGAMSRYERALTVDPCHYIAHRFLADTMIGLPDLTKAEAFQLAGHAVDALVCNPRYDAGWGTLGAVFPGSARGMDLRLQDPAAYAMIRARTAAGEGDALDRRIAAVTAVLAEGAPATTLWKVLGLAKKLDLLTEAVAFETLDEEIAAAYRARRLDSTPGLRAWILATRVPDPADAAPAAP